MTLNSRQKHVLFLTNKQFPHGREESNSETTVVNGDHGEKVWQVVKINSIVGHK